METTTNLVKKRLKYHKSRTVFTAVAIMLTTMLLMALGSSIVGLMDGQKQAVSSQTNSHASMKNLTGEQMQVLKNHLDVEAVETQEIFAQIQYEKMNAFLTRSETLKGAIYQGTGGLTQGKFPQESNEICGPPAFFERMGVKPEIGTKFNITFRPGEGEYVTKEFTICGLVSQADVSKISVSDDRIVYGASVSEALVKEYLPDDQRTYTARIRVNGEEQLNYDQIKEKIKKVAQNIGCKENDLDYNTEYLVAMTDPGREMIGGAALIALIVCLFSGLVIYSIYYVCVITDVQEIGKLKALGASKRHIRKLLLLEGLFVSMIAIPPGILLGYLIPKIGLPLLMKAVSKYSVFTVEQSGAITIFSWPVLLGAIAVVLFTVLVSLLKPVSMAEKISPIEAIRYQESSDDKRKQRDGYENLNLGRLSRANLIRNKKRTVITIMTMGLSCVLFISVAALANSMSINEFARRTIPKGDFIISLKANYNDKTYPETNLDEIQKKNPMDENLMKQIESIDGVKKVEKRDVLLAGADDASENFENGRRAAVTWFTREDIPKLREELKRGELDYDRLVAEHGILYGYDSIMEEEGLAMGKKLSMSFYRGDEKVPFEGTIAVSGSWGRTAFMLPKELFDELAGNLNATTDLYIYVDSSKYDQIKPVLREIVEKQECFSMYSIDEELEMAKLSVNMIKYPLYAILILIGVISFMNLINTMVTSIITRKRELAVLQAIGLSDRQLIKMLTMEGMVFTAGTLIAALTVGNILGYFIFLWGKNTGFMDVKVYQYPVWESIGLVLVLIAGQLIISRFIGKRVHRESLVDRMRSGE